MHLFLYLYVICIYNLFVCYYRLLALKALNNRLIDSSKEIPRGNNLDSEKRDTVIISIGDSEQSPQASHSGTMSSNKTT